MDFLNNVSYDELIIFGIHLMASITLSGECTNFVKMYYLFWVTLMLAYTSQKPKEIQMKN